jgi:hypothetical protein
VTWETAHAAEIHCVSLRLWIFLAAASCGSAFRSGLLAADPCSLEKVSPSPCIWPHSLRMSRERVLKRLRRLVPTTWLVMTGQQVNTLADDMQVQHELARLFTMNKDEVGCQRLNRGVAANVRDGARSSTITRVQESSSFLARIANMLVSFVLLQQPSCWYLRNVANAPHQRMQR